MIDAVFGLHAGLGCTADTDHRGSSPPSWRATGAVERATTHDVTVVGTGDFVVLAADVHGVDESLDLVVLARRPP